MAYLNSFDYITLIPILTLIIFVGGACAAFFIKPTEFHNTRIFVFISIMGSMAVIILSFNVILTTSGLKIQEKVNRAQFTKQAVDKLWLFPNQILTEKKNARPEFLASLYYNNKALYQLAQHEKNKPTVATALDEQYISIVLIQAWEDYLTLRGLDDTGDSVWINCFIQWAQSPYLKTAFNTLKYNFADTTIAFGNLLLDHAAHIPVPTTDPEIYKEVVNKIIKDPKFLAVCEERQRHSYLSSP